MSVNTSDNTIKIIRSSVLEDRAYDTSSNGRYNSSQYCNDSSYGCNIYGSTSSLYNSSGSAIRTLARQVNGTKYQLPSKESEISTYLNGTYYNSLNATARSMIKSDAVYKAGVLKNQSGQTASTDISQVSAAKWKGKVALIDATEYIRASTYSSCTNMYLIDSGNCASNNWMNISDTYWTMSPYSDSYSRNVWYVYSNGRPGGNLAYGTYGVRPVVTLSPEVKITGGNGSESNAYTLDI